METNTEAPARTAAAVILHADTTDGQHGRIEVVTFDLDDSFRFLQTSVDGRIEMVGLHDRFTWQGTPGAMIADAWLNADSKHNGMAGNGQARELFERHAGVSPFDVPCGPVVITTASPMGDTRGITAEAVRILGIDANLASAIAAVEAGR